MESEHAMDAFVEEQKSNIVPSSSSTSQQMSVSVDEDVNVDDLNALSLDEIIENGMKSLAEASILIDQASKVTEKVNDEYGNNYRDRSASSTEEEDPTFKMKKKQSVIDALARETARIIHEYRVNESRYAKAEEEDDDIFNPLKTVSKDSSIRKRKEAASTSTSASPVRRNSRRDSRRTKSEYDDNGEEDMNESGIINEEDENNIEMIDPREKLFRTLLQDQSKSKKKKKGQQSGKPAQIGSFVIKTLKEAHEIQKRSQSHLVSQPSSSQLPSQQLQQQQILSPPRMLSMCAVEGYLLKYKGSLMSAWSKKWFVLSGRHLLYYETASSSLPKGAIDLINAEVEAYSGAATPSGFEIRLVYDTRTKTIRLSPDNKEDTLAWTQALMNNINTLIEAAKLTGALGYVPIAMDPSIAAAATTSGSGGSMSASNATMMSASASATNIGQTVMLNQLSSNTADIDAMSGRKNSLGGFDALLGEEQQTFYSILGIDNKANTAAIRKAYFKISKESDNSTDILPEDLARISNAFQVLKDEETRELYDLSCVVKKVLRKGLLANMVILKPNDNGDDTGASISPYSQLNQDEPSAERVFFIDSMNELLLWQKKDNGSVLGEGYRCIELRFVQRIYGGIDPGSKLNLPADIDADRLVTISGQGLWCEDIHMELDSKEARDIFLDGLKFITFWKSS